MKESSNTKKSPVSAALYLATSANGDVASSELKNARSSHETRKEPANTSDKLNHRLNSVKVGQRAVISVIKQGCPSPLLHKLLSMGIVAGTEVKVTQRGFFGSPINIHLFGSVLSLRSAEAAQIQVTPI